MSENCILESKRVQVPFDTPVLSFVRFAPNDGFRPQSGLVQRGVLYAAFGGISPRESVSRGSQVALLPYEPRLLATPVGEICSTINFVLKSS